MAPPIEWKKIKVFTGQVVGMEGEDGLKRERKGGKEGRGNES